MSAPATLHGKDYVLVKGEQLTGPGGVIVAVRGETCELVDQGSLPWLLEQGYLALASDLTNQPPPAAPIGEDGED